MPSTTQGRFAGSTALVTGAAGAGIGQAVVRRLATEGAHVVVSDVHQGRLAAVHAALVAEGLSVAALLLDTGDLTAVRHAVDGLTEEGVTVDLLVNNAAVNTLTPVHATDVEDWRRVMDVDLNGPWALIRHLLPGMRQRGRGAIVNVASAAVHNAEFEGAAYMAAKAGLTGLTRAVAHEAGPDGVRCNAVAPGIIRSAFVERHAERFTAERARTPLRRFADPAEVAAVIAFLLSDDASFVTGETVLVTGGRVVRA